MNSLMFLGVTILSENKNVFIPFRFGLLAKRGRVLSWES